MLRPLCTTAALAAIVPAQNNAGWSTPVAETVLNTVSSEAGPSLSLDGLTLHFSSSVSGNWEIYVSTRQALGAPWGPPTLVNGPSDVNYVDDQPFLTADGLQLWFSTNNRPGGAGNSDIMVCTRPNLQAPWGAPSFVTELNSPLADSAPSLTGDGLEVYFLSTGWGNPSPNNNNSIFRATRTSTSQPFGTPVLVTEFSTPLTHRDAEVSFDGLSFTYTEYESVALRRMQVWNADRADRNSPWNAPAVWHELTNVGSTLGVYAITRMFTGNEAVLSANFGTAGAQELMSTRFDGLTHLGLPSAGNSLTLFYRDSLRPGHAYAMAAALGNTGFTVGSLQVPIDGDFLFVGTFARDFPPFTSGFFGMLDANGEAAATVTNTSSVLLGLPAMWACAVTFDPTAPLGVSTVSNAVPFRMQ